MTVQYNRRDARKDSVLTADELKQKVMHEFENKGILVIDDDHSKYALAIEKRRSFVSAEYKTVKFQEPPKAP